MENIPVLDLHQLHGERSKTMATLHEACERWGFFRIDNHGIDQELMEKVRQMVNSHYEQHMKPKFSESEMVKNLKNNENTSDLDWETAFVITHHPTPNIHEFPNLSEEFCKTMDEYVAQVIKLAEKLGELISENLGLEKTYIKEAFSGSKGPSVGTKVAKYPECPRPELVRGLREHFDAGGIVVMLQDDQVAGLEFLKDGEWVPIPPSKSNNTIYVNTGDQLEVISNGRYKSALHRVLAGTTGSRLSIATFYNPGSDAIISPAPGLLYPQYQFQDYMKVYLATKFATDKAPRFEAVKSISG